MALNTLIIDGNNLLHRARSGFTLGEHFVAFNFFRGLRAMVEKLKPTRITMVLDGEPKKRLELSPDYKANRKLDADSTDPNVQRKLVELADFRAQMNRIVQLLSSSFPITVMRHPEVEADDLVAYLVESTWAMVPITVVSTDTDYIQLLNKHENVKLYNPITKSYVAAVSHDYALWKALRGDPTDNVAGLVSDDRAMELCSNEATMREWLLEGSNAVQLGHNAQLIRFMKLSVNEVAGVKSSAPKRDWDAVKSQFVEWGFASICKPSAWDKFVATFDGLFGKVMEK